MGWHPPEREEILVCGMGLSGVALQSVGASLTEVGEYIARIRAYDSACDYLFGW
jgi:hypothetical protein